MTERCSGYSGSRLPNTLMSQSSHSGSWFPNAPKVSCSRTRVIGSSSPLASLFFGGLEIDVLRSDLGEMIFTSLAKGARLVQEFDHLGFRDQFSTLQCFSICAATTRTAEAVWTTMKTQLAWCLSYFHGGNGRAEGKSIWDCQCATACRVERTRCIETDGTTESHMVHLSEATHEPKDLHWSCEKPDSNSISARR